MTYIFTGEEDEDGLAAATRAMGEHSIYVCAVNPTDYEELFLAATALPPEAVTCSGCLTPLMPLDIASNGYRCPLCGARVCVLCGCTDEAACEGGCAWTGLGICSTHENELRAEVARVFAEDTTNVRRAR